MSKITSLFFFLASPQPPTHFGSAMARGKTKSSTVTIDDSQHKTNKRQQQRPYYYPLKIMAIASGLKSWSAQERNGLKDFLSAQAKVAVVLAAAHFGNIYEPAYPRNDNHSPPTFWMVNGVLAALTLASVTHKPSSGRDGGTPRIVMLGREQTEEWKGWMQWGFIFYHYYRVYYVYNEIRVFVSAYVWMVRYSGVVVHYVYIHSFCTH